MGGSPPTGGIAVTWWEFMFEGPGLVVVAPAGAVLAGSVLAMIGQGICNRIGRK